MKNKTQSCDIVADIKAVLEFYEAMGIEKIDVALPSSKSKKSPGASGRVSVPGMETTESGRRSSEEKAELLQNVREDIGDCQRCKLCKARTNIVYGDGNPDAAIMFIGEGPGKEEDIQGLPFVGEAGMVLTKLIEKMGFKRTDFYIGNIVKCRPPMNRDPEEDEISSCRQFIEKQIDIIRPEVIFTLGRIALQTLMGNPRLKITAARGNFFDYRGIPLMPTFHPAYLLRNPKDKWLTWADAQKVLEKLNLAKPE